MITDDDRRAAARCWGNNNPPPDIINVIAAHREAAEARGAAKERTAVVQLRKAAARLIEFVDGLREQQRPDVWWLRVAALRRAIERGGHSDQQEAGE